MEVLEHHGGTPDLADGVRDASAGYVRGGPVNRFEEAGESPFGIDISTWGDADGTGACRTKVREDVTEEVAGDDDVEPVGVQDEVRCEDVDVKLVDLQIGVALGHLFHTFVPIGHGDGDAVALGG